MLPSYRNTLTAGVYSVSIIVDEQTIRCLLSGNNASDQAILDLLVHQLYYMSGYKTDYKLCRPHNDNNQVPKYNCCTIVGRHNITICSDYSSIVTKVFPILVLVTVFFLICIDSPVILEYLSQYKEDNTHYSISDSPMSLSSILHSVFIEGHGPVKSFGRKLMFVLFVLVTTLPEWGDLLVVYVIFVCPWAFIFPFFDPLSFNENDNLTVTPLQSLGYTFKNPIEIITRPFNIKLWRHRVSTKWPRYFRSSNLNITRNSSIQKSETSPQLLTTTQGSLGECVSLLPQPENDRREFGFREKMKCRFSILIFLVVYLVTLPFLCLHAFWLLILYNAKCFAFKTQEVIMAERSITKIFKYFWFFYFLSMTFLLIGFSIRNLFLLTFYFIVGLFLNGEIYSPYVVPLATILFYAWQSWRSSVETKYLVLNTNIYEVCQESIAMEGDEYSNSITENGGNVSNATQSSTTGPFRKSFKIKLDDDRGPIIPKELYDLVRERFLPYDQILFHYFQGVFFIAIFAYLLYIMMSLAQKSGISNSVRIIGTIAATSTPLIFDFAWKKSTDEQKAANTIVLKSKLKRLLLLHSLDNTIREMVVEFTGNY